jgi:hypothetical protein
MIAPGGMSAARRSCECFEAAQSASKRAKAISANLESP